MKTRLLILVTVMLALCSCNKSDDLDEIFSGKFKITGYRVNGQWDNEKLKELNKSMDNYWIIFSGGTFNGMLIENIPFNGTWKADAESRSMKMTVGEIPVYPSELSRFVINILKNATSYSGDHNVLRIQQDNNNYIDLNSGAF